MSLVLALLLSSGIAVLLSTRSFSHALAAETITCADEPTAAHCNGQDPQGQGCATPGDVRTVAQADILAGGRTIGRVERRYSLSCHSWWGRVFDNSGTHAINITIAGKSYTNSFPGEIYSLMVFDPPYASVPAITGTILLSAASADTTVSATLPAIPVTKPAQS
jgi:hypothetical protein